eukprot:3735214-Pleurochrysis_carterae.AAC.3
MNIDAEADDHTQTSQTEQFASEHEPQLRALAGARKALARTFSGVASGCSSEARCEDKNSNTKRWASRTDCSSSFHSSHNRRRNHNCISIIILSISKGNTTSISTEVFTVQATKSTAIALAASQKKEVAEPIASPAETSPTRWYVTSRIFPMHSPLENGEQARAPRKHAHTDTAL